MMKYIRRWTTSIVSSFDAMINQIENHEALVNSAIREVQEAGARAKVQFGRVQRDGQRMRKHLIELRTDVEQWRERAMRSAKLDESRAIECVRRMKRTEQEIGRLEEEEREHSKLEKQLSHDLKLIDERLARLKEQRNLLRTRQSRAEALKTLKSEDSNIISEIDVIFERWQEKVAGYELQIDSLEASKDSLEEEFCHEELEKDLRDSLRDMLCEATTMVEK